MSEWGRWVGRHPYMAINPNACAVLTEAGRQGEVLGNLRTVLNLATDLKLLFLKNSLLKMRSQKVRSWV